MHPKLARYHLRYASILQIESCFAVFGFAFSVLKQDRFSCFSIISLLFCSVKMDFYFCSAFIAQCSTSKFVWKGQCFRVSGEGGKISSQNSCSYYINILLIIFICTVYKYSYICLSKVQKLSWCSFLLLDLNLKLCYYMDDKVE